MIPVVEAMYSAVTEGIARYAKQSRRADNNDYFGGTEASISRMSSRRAGIPEAATNFVTPT